MATYRFHLIGQNNNPLTPNVYFDAKTAVRAVMGTSANNPANIDSYVDADDIHLRIIEVEPLDADLPLETITYWMDAQGMGANRRLKYKYKDLAGVVRTADGPIFT